MNIIGNIGNFHRKRIINMMKYRVEDLADRLMAGEALSREEYAFLIDCRTPETEAALAKEAAARRESIYGKKIFARGLIEISNCCRNDCYYCGIRRSNGRCERYRLMPEEILSCAVEGYELGFRTFVLQGGEDDYFTDEILCPLIRTLKERFPDCAVTLSLGERNRESYRRLFDAGADRYLLRHETASEAHYKKLHPAEMSFENRMRCLWDLKETGFQAGCGFMVGSPHQTSRELSEDLAFIAEFKPDMCGIGPFIPHRDTPFASEPAGTVGLTCFLLSVIRLIHPPVLLPATTALATLDPRGREKGILSGANVVMPNLSPENVRSKYDLYDHKAFTGMESARCLADLSGRMREIGCELAVDRGDVRKEV